MTENLTERLRRKAAAQTSESEKIISAELAKLTPVIRQQLTDVLRSIQNDIAAQSLRISADLAPLSLISRHWLIAAGALISCLLILTGFLAWRLLSQPSLPEGQILLLLPIGSEMATCKVDTQNRPCILMPPTPQTQE